MNETTKSRSADPRTEDTRARLLAATTRCLARAGVGGTTSREIARESGVNLQGIAYHFGSKDALVAEALLGSIRGWIEPALEILGRDIDPVRRMLMAVRALQGAFRDAQSLLPVYLEALVHAQRDDEFGARVRELMTELHGFMTAHIAELRKRGAIPGWVDPRAMATLQIAAVDGVALHAALDPEGVDTKKVAAQGVRLLIAAREKKRKNTRAKSRG